MCVTLFTVMRSGTGKPAVVKCRKDSVACYNLSVYSSDLLQETQHRLIER